MRKILFILILFSFNKTFSQLELKYNPFIEGEIILKSGDTLNGYIRLNDSPFDIRYKDSLEQKKPEKISYKTISKIVNNKSTHSREFYYKYSNLNKFLTFVELIHTSSINIYINASNNLDLFYTEYERLTVHDKINEQRNEITKNSVIQNKQHGILLDDNDHFLKRNYSNFSYYINITIGSTRYFLEKSNQEKIIHVGNSGNPFTKKFKKTANKYFEDCPELVHKISNKELKLDDLPEIIEFYNENCK